MKKTIAAICVALASGACKGPDCGAFEYDRTRRVCVCPSGTIRIDGGTCETIDASIDAGLCEPSDEICNGVDDDCDGPADEAVSCGTVDHASGTACVGGACVPTCHEGYDDCNDRFDDGCETDLASAEAHCGVCNHACNPGEGCLDRVCGAVPQYGWVRTGASARGDHGERIAVDAAGNIYVAGLAGTSPYTFDSIVQERTLAGSAQHFLASYAADGALRYVLRFEVADVRDIVALPSGSIAVVGTLGSSSRIEDRSFSGADQDGFVAIVSSGGSVYSVRVLGGPGTDSASSVVYGESGELVVVGTSARGFVIDDVEIAAGSYVVELGSLLDVSRAGTLPGAVSHAASRGNTLAVAGTFSGTLTVGSSMLTATDSDAFAAWCDIPTFACSNAVSVAREGWGSPTSVTLTDEADAVLATWQQVDTYYEPSMAAYSRTGEVRWEHALRTEGFVSSVVFDGSSILALASFVRPATLAGRTHNPAGGYDLLLFEIASDGTIGWVSQSTGVGNETAGALALAPDGSLAITGSYSDGAIIAGVALHESDPKTSPEQRDVFTAIARYR